MILGLQTWKAKWAGELKNEIELKNLAAKI